jgi:ribonuclease G
VSNELIINKSSDGTRIVLLENKELVEFHQEGKEAKFNVGDLFLGTVRKVVPGLNAAFVDVGYEKDAFLHYQDLGPNIKSLNLFVKQVMNKKNNDAMLENFHFEPEIEKLGNIDDVLVKGQKILVQIEKEPISSKGPRLSCQISLAGRYVVMVPFSDSISISRKISDNAERKRLIGIVKPIKPQNFGLIIRTVAENVELEELQKDMLNLIDKWKVVRKNLKSAESKDKVLGEIDRTSALIRDLVNESFDSILIDDQDLFNQASEYIKQVAPGKEKIVKYHNNSKTKLFESTGVEKQLKMLFGKSVSLKEGGYLIIEHTEALHVVDVNSGNKAIRESDQEDTAFKTNLAAVQELSRQLRLRDMGGIIVVDFIDMKSLDNRKAIFDAMKDELDQDKAKSVVLPISKFGLMQITRQRVRPEMNIITSEVCPSCDGSGKISASLNVTTDIDENIKYLLTQQNAKKITLVVHEFMYSYLTKGFLSKRVLWLFSYKKWVNIEIDSSLGLIDFKILDENGEKIELL